MCYNGNVHQETPAGTRPEVAIIGAGRVGTALGVLLARSGYPVGGVVCRCRKKAAEAVQIIGAGTAFTDPVQGAQGAEIIFITVPDQHIASVAAQIARGLSLEPTNLLVHTSGALPADAMRVAGSEKALCLSFHPIQTIADRSAGADRLKGAYFGLEGDAPAVEIGRQIALDLGGMPLPIKPGAKAHYHAAACMASNYFVTLIDASLLLYERAGIPRPEALKALEPLLSGAWENILSVGIPRALTGPIERGDSKTIQAHLKALAAETPEKGDNGVSIDTLYRLMGLATLELARRKNRDVPDAIQAEKAYETIKRLLQSEV